MLTDKDLLVLSSTSWEVWAIYPLSTLYDLYFKSPPRITFCRMTEVCSWCKREHPAGRGRRKLSPTSSPALWLTIDKVTALYLLHKTIREKKKKSLIRRLTSWVMVNLISLIWSGFISGIRTTQGWCRSSCVTKIFKSVKTNNRIRTPCALNQIVHRTPNSHHRHVYVILRLNPVSLSSEISWPLLNSSWIPSNCHPSV